MVRRGSGRPINYASYNDDESNEEDQESEASEVQDSDEYDSEPVKKKTKKASPVKKKGKGASKKAAKSPRQKISPSKTPASKKKYPAPSRSSSGRAKNNVSYASESESSEEEEEEEQSESEVSESEEEEDYRQSSSKKKQRGRPSKKQEMSSKKFYNKLKASKKEKEEQFPPVSEMVIESIKALKDNPKKGSTIGTIKETIALNWPVNMKVYDPKIKKFVLKALERGELLQPKGKGLRGRFTVPGLKAKKVKKKKNKLTKKLDEDEEEYQPKKTARDEEREKDRLELERQREERRIQQEQEEEKKAARPKKKIVRREEWEVEAIKGKKEKKGETFYLVKFKGWNKPQWEPEENVEGCDEALDEYYRREEERIREEEERKKKRADGDWEVRKIVDVQFLKDNKREFQIRWVGCTPADDTWEPEENLNCPDLIEKFMANLEKESEVDTKSLRDYRKPVERLAFAGFGSRNRKRQGGFRVTYEGMDE